MSRLTDAAEDLERALEGGADTDEVRALLDRVAEELKEWCVTTPSGVGALGVDGAPDWYGHEIASWRLCERIREATRARYNRKVPDVLCGPVERVVSMPEVGKGRQAWALFAVDIGKAEAARRLAPHLHDEEVNAHVLKGLTRYRVPGFEVDVERVSRESTSPLTRRNAKKYLAAVGADASPPTAG